MRVRLRVRVIITNVHEVRFTCFVLYSFSPIHEVRFTCFVLYRSSEGEGEGEG
jgi:hypothetical protein